MALRLSGRARAGTAISCLKLTLSLPHTCLPTISKVCDGLTGNSDHAPVECKSLPSESRVVATCSLPVRKGWRPLNETVVTDFATASWVKPDTPLGETVSCIAAACEAVKHTPLAKDTLPEKSELL